MAVARCPVEVFERSQLPRLCVVHGGRADGWFVERANSPVGAQWLLLLLGIFPFVLVRALTKKSAVGRVPVSQAGFEDLTARARGAVRRAWIVRLIGLVIITAGVVSAVSTDDPLLVIFAFVLGGIIFVAAEFAGVDRNRVSSSVEPSGRWVVLHGVHPNFAQAVDRMGRGPSPTRY